MENLRWHEIIIQQTMKYSTHKAIKLTFSEPRLSSGWLAEHCRAPSTHDDCLCVTEHCRDFVASCNS